MKHTSWYSAALVAATLIAASAAHAGVKEGDKMPAIKATTIDGKSIDLSKMDGQVAVVDLWATWCPPCREAIPHIQALYERHRSHGLRVVGVSLAEGKDKPAEYARKNKMTYTVAWTTRPQAQAIGQETGVEAIPTLYVVDRKGVVRMVETGFGSDTEQRLEKLVQKLLAEKA